MRLYFAGDLSGGYSEEATYCRIAGMCWRLLSFSLIGERNNGDIDFWGSDAAPRPFFLDSGAYSAMSRGVTIDLSEYCSFIKQYREKIDPYASLDVIGDWKGCLLYTSPSPRDRQKSRMPSSA